jgi:UDP-3-O-[3-hydroxymyristoyl] glucosamine N-acyltransferase
MTTNSIKKIEIRIEDEFATISATKTFDDSANEEINVVNKRIKTFSFISSKIKFVTEFEDAKIIEVAEIIEDAEIIENAKIIENAEIIEEAEINEDAETIKNAKIIEEFESESNR